MRISTELNPRTQNRQHLNDVIKNEEKQSQVEGGSRGSKGLD